MDVPVAKELLPKPTTPKTSRDWVEAIEAAMSKTEDPPPDGLSLQRTMSGLEAGRTASIGSKQEKLAQEKLSGGRLDETAAREAGGMTYRKWQLGEIMESKAARCFFISLVLVNAVLIGIRVC